MHNRDQILRHVRYREGVTGTASADGESILGKRYPLMISPHDDDENKVSLFVLKDKKPYAVKDVLLTQTEGFERLVDEFLELVDKRTVAFLYEGETDIPKDVRRYYYEHLDQGNSKSKAFAIAWSRYCKYKNPNSPRCKQKVYFAGRGKG